MKLRSPFVIASLAGLAVLVAAFAPAVVHLLLGGPPVAPAAGPPAPWQIDTDAHGRLRAFGLRLPGSTLADAQALWGDGLELGVIARSGQPGALEAYVERWQGGGISGRLVLATDAGLAQVQGWQQRAAKSERIDAQAARWTLHEDDREAAMRAQVVGVTFIAQSDLDPVVIEQRFGPPAERIATGGRIDHWLYPRQAMAIAVDREGRDVIQVVAHADFERRLRRPLLAAGVSPAASSPAADRPH